MMYRTLNLGTVLLSAVLVVTAADAQVVRDDSLDDAATDSPLLTDFDDPFSFTYLGFDEGVSSRRGQAVIQTKDGKGGAAYHLDRDWSGFSDHSPALYLRLGPQNKASQIKLQLTDANEGKRNFTYELDGISVTEFQRVLPNDAQALDGGDFDPSKVKGLHVQGNWRGDRIDLRIDKVEFVAPSTEMLAVRQAAAERQQRSAERKRKQEAQQRMAREALLRTGSEHPEDGPEVVHVGAAGADLLGIEIQAGRIPPAAPVAYRRQTGDVHKPSDQEKLAWLDGRPAIVPAGYELYRQESGKNRTTKIGQLNLYQGTVWTQRREGAELDVNVVDETRAYRISIDGGPPIEPTAVYRKSKPNSVAQVSGDVMAQHFVYLKLPEPLRQDATYTIDFFALNTRQAKVNFKHSPRTQRSEAIHVSHLGYRKDDPLKRAYLSLWTGTGGGQTFAAPRFELLDESGETVDTGAVRLAVAADQIEPFSGRRNHTGANVYHLDFSDFDRDGKFVVHVPGLGISYPLVIGPSQWREAFGTSMHGFLSHRSGIELGPPWSDYVRPRNMHPDDGFVVFKTDVTFWDGESDAIASSLKRLLGPELDPSRLEKHPDAWGGYMDAGDWDRRSQHLVCSLRHLELLEMFPQTVANFKLSLPPSEASNDIPDLMDEALWNIDFYRRLQEPSGGVGGGVESTAHPRPGEASWQETLMVGAYRPDPETSYRYAAVAAKAARLLGDHPRAAKLQTSAVNAWRWSQANAQTEIQAAIDRNAKKASSAAKAVRNMKALAAIELYHLTGDAAYHQQLQVMDADVLEEADTAMCYALLPKHMTRAELRRQAVDAITGAADAALDFGSKNGFNISLFTSSLPMMGYTCIWSTPGAVTPPVLPRAHFLTGDQRYLQGTLASCQYSGGANPMNMCYTTGIGPRQPLAPLHIDYRLSGQQPPAGITVYGQSDPSTGYAFDSFAHTWFLNRYGGVHSHQWPTAEAYIDLGNWPAMNEYTVHQTFSPTSYTWGYLAAADR